MESKSELITKIVEGEKHYTTTVILVTEEIPRKVLLVFHKNLNKWVPPGGHQERHENPIETGIREVLEETGIDITDYISGKANRHTNDLATIFTPDYFFEERIDPVNGQPVHYHLDNIYVVYIHFQEISLSSCGHNKVRWFSLNELQNISLFNNVKIIIDDLMQKEAGIKK